MTACSFAVSAHVCWNWAVKAARTACPRSIPGHTLSTCKSLDTRRPGSIRRLCRAGTERDPLKVATLNINNIKRLDNLLAWLAKAEPDVVSLQELKAEQEAFPVNALRTLGYEAVWQGERSWNGVAILARHQVPVLTCTSLPGNPEDHQSRYIEAAVNGVLITSIYLPNGNPQPGPKFNYKLAWFERLIAHAAELMASGAPMVLAGDYNVVPTPQDIYPTRSLDNNALIQPESRQAFACLLAQGWTDAMRKLHPDGPLWTFWDYKFERWQKDKGMRLDHFLLSPNLSDRLVDGGVDRWARGQENASDHAPTWITLDV
jgi:exodeoxyribonuclease III